MGSPSTGSGGHEPTFGYRPALDGVRALAVTAVLLFHAGLAFLPGGFLGVDAFFVLSGYLITALLLAEHARRGRIALGAFWGRRARRLLPALLVMLSAVAIVDGRLFPDVEVALLRGDALAALGYLANWRMIYRGNDYFAQTAAPSPLQHTWSLGIEEQFYLLWPLIVTALLLLAARRRATTALLAVCATGAAGSALTAALLYRPDDVNRSYFGTDTRAQALLIGCALAALLHNRAGTVPAPRRHPLLGALAIGGAAFTGYLWCVAHGTDAALYRGGLTAGALAIAAVLAHAELSPSSPTARLLALPPLVWIGKISYGLYLWHWPLFGFVTAERTGLTGPALPAVRLSLVLAVAVASYWLVERPIRRTRRLRGLPRLVPAATVATAMAAVAVLVAAATAPGPAASIAAAPVITVPSPTATPPSSGAVPPMRRPDREPGAEPRITIFGDSIAWTLGTYLPEHPGLTVTTRAIQGCGIALLPDILQLGTPHTNYPNCVTWPSRWQRAVDTDDPDVAVILLNRWELMDRRLNGAYQHVGQPEFDAYLTGQLNRAIEIAGSRGAHVALLTAAYTHRAERPDGGVYAEDEPARVDAWNALLRAAAGRQPGRVTVLDLNPVVCPGGTFTWRVGGLRVRSDGLHFTPAAVQRLIAPWLLPQVAKIAATGEP